MERIAILGGTGPEGMGLGLRLSQTGARVILGSRQGERARAAAAEAKRRLGQVGREGSIDAGENAAAARESDIVFLAIPYAGIREHAPTLRSVMAGKLVVDVINPLRRSGTAFLPEALGGRSAGELLHELLPESRVVSALKNQSAESLLHIEHPLAGDVLVCGEDEAARTQIIGLIGRLRNLRGVDAGAMINARLVEAVTALLLNLNRRHRAITSIRILGLPESPSPGGGE